ncbi:primosomal protein N' [Bacillaceae bacterium Marseille-Q3522]|nr:primosomal protein N' [Bacillaceae bacterium Marseille-Q3522]
MSVARVIVDVPAKQTDKPFDYRIPDHLQDVITPGIRVVVPFGSRKVQGFVVSVEETSHFDKLKNLIEPLDLTPILNEELLSLASWLTEQTLCFKISAFQVMLPAALKAKYNKLIKKSAECPDEKLHPELANLFQQQSSINWKDALQQVDLAILYKEVRNHHIEVIYEVKERIKKKTKKYVMPAGDKEQLFTEQEQLPKQAAKQQQLLAFMIEHPEPIEAAQLLAMLPISPAVVKGLVKKGILLEKEVEVYRNPYEHKEFRQTKPLPLTTEQNRALTTIIKQMNQKKNAVCLLYGVTGSGKTEVYLQSIHHVLQKGKEAIVLVPEISLTPQMVKRFKERFGDLVAVMHSGLSAGEKYDEWRKIQRKEVKVVVGARSAIFAPFENIGIIIIDEEHETSYKQEEVPSYHARDVAIERSKFHQCPVILGSATPSLESFARAQKGNYHLLKLTKRMNNHAMPTVEIVDMRNELRNGNRSMFSTSLYEKVKERIAKKEQTVLFLNKRGYSSFVMCRDCGYVVQCPHCDISLTYHRFQEKMKCHYCGYESQVPAICPECGSEHIRFFGTGTQKVEEELGKILPEARVIRMDVDTTNRKGAHEKLLTEFAEKKADILLGTQMIAKGLDFPSVTLVGVLSADTTLHLPDFRSAEKTFQLLTQVSGRAGRHELEGEVVIQTYTPEHYSVALAGRQDFEQFYDQEMRIRRNHQYPPFYYLALVTICHENLLKTVSVAGKITNYLQGRLTNRAIILGPVASPITRINNKYRYQCIIKYKNEPRLFETLKQISNLFQHETATSSLQILIDVNPYVLM